MANNNGIFNAVLAGASGALISGRWLNNPILASYDNVRLGALNLANAIDALIAPDVTLTQSDFDLMLELVQGAVWGRFAKATADVSEVSVAIVAAWTNISAEVLSVPDVPPLIVENLAWDGLAPLTQVVLAAPHTAGMYLINGVIQVNVAAAAGIVDRAVTWTDGDGVVETQLLTAAFSVSTPTPPPYTQPIGVPGITLISNGLGAISIEWQPSGVIAGPQDLDAFAGSQFIGRRT